MNLAAALFRRYRVVAFVAADKTEPPVEPRTRYTFAEIFNLRPNNYRFVIVEVTEKAATLEDPIGPNKFWCFDLYHDSLLDKGRRAVALLAPGPKWTSDSKEGLIMKALALYDHE